MFKHEVWGLGLETPGYPIICEDGMNKKELRFAFNEVLNVAENMRCENLHHAKKHQHKMEEMCPVEYHIQKQAHIVREYMKQNGI